MSSFESIITIIMGITIIVLVCIIIVLLAARTTSSIINDLVSEHHLELSDVSHKSRSYHFIKRVFDIVFGSLFCIGALPFLAVFYIAICIEDRGPALYSRQCVGTNGKTVVYKCFRTLRMEADRLDNHPLLTYEYDPRLTRMGLFLRKTGLDYLPMIFSVVKGDLTLIGLARILPEVGELNSNYKALFNYEKPGIVGLSSIVNNTKINREQIDLIYLHKRSIWMDIVILTYVIPNKYISLNRTGD